MLFRKMVAQVIHARWQNEGGRLSALLREIYIGTFQMHAEDCCPMVGGNGRAEGCGSNRDGSRLLLPGGGDRGGHEPRHPVARQMRRNLA